MLDNCTSGILALCNCCRNVFIKPHELAPRIYCIHHKSQTMCFAACEVVLLTFLIRTPLTVVGAWLVYTAFADSTLCKGRVRGKSKHKTRDLHWECTLNVYTCEPHWDCNMTAETNIKHKLLYIKKIHYQHQLLISLTYLLPFFCNILLFTY